MEPVHVVTDKKNISELVLMPGDPLRAKYIAENFLDNDPNNPNGAPILVNEIRNMLGYTGTYKGVKVTVIGSGMGIPSMGIYSYELAEFYGAKKIIRIGSAGSLNENVHIKDLVVATEARSISTFAYAFSKDKSTTKYASPTLIEKFKNLAEKNVHFGPILTSDTFDVYSGIDHVLKDLNFTNPLAVEMETFGLYHIGEIKHVDVATILTVVDSKYEPDKIVSAEDRQTSLNDMIKLALEVLIADEKI